MKKKLQKLMQWLNRPRFIIFQTPTIEFKSGFTQEEKIEILKMKLAHGYEDHDKATGTVNIHPVQQAENEIKQIKKNGLVDYYFDLYLLSKKHQAEFNELNTKYGR